MIKVSVFKPTKEVLFVSQLDRHLHITDICGFFSLTLHESTFTVQMQQVQQTPIIFFTSQQSYQRSCVMLMVRAFGPFIYRNEKSQATRPLVIILNQLFSSFNFKPFDG